MASLFRDLERAGWHIVYADPVVALPKRISRRYPALAASEAFRHLSTLRSCASPDDKAWFICPPDFRKGSNAFRWDEFEQISLEAADGDAELIESIAAFWDRHVPIFLCVRSGYEYFALDLESPSGAIVHGVEPDFEEVSIAFESFGLFLGSLIQQVKNGADFP